MPSVLVVHWHAHCLSLGKELWPGLVREEVVEQVLYEVADVERARCAGPIEGDWVTAFVREEDLHPASVCGWMCRSSQHCCSLSGLDDSPSRAGRESLTRIRR